MIKYRVNKQKTEFTRLSRYMVIQARGLGWQSQKGAAAIYRQWALINRRGRGHCCRVCGGGEVTWKICLIT